MAARREATSIETTSSSRRSQYHPDFKLKQTSQVVDSYACKDRTWYGKESNSQPKTYNTSTPSNTKLKQRPICNDELHEVEKRLEICHQDFSSSYMKNIIREIDVNKSSNAEEVIALKELFQKVSSEMVHLRKILSHRSETASHFKVHSQEKQSSAELEHSPSQTTDDLVQLRGPLTDNKVLTILKERFNAGSYYTNIGPVVVSVNPFGSSEEYVEHKANDNLFLKTLVERSLQQLFEMQTSQILILSGETGSGKSFTSQLLLHQLLHVTCAGNQTDLAKQLIASVTVLRSLGKAKTTNNADSSRVAKLYEFFFTNQIISKTRIQCYALDMSRIVRPREGERNFHIFYQLFAGLNPKDRAKLHLQTHSAHELRYLYNYPIDDQTEVEVLKTHFQSWKLALLVLGIPFSDVTRVLAAILLLGNVHFKGKVPDVLVVEGGDFELQAVGFLLGVSYVSLFRGLTTKSKLIRGEITIVQCTAAQANSSRDALSKTLYSRTLSAIVRRCNCLRKSTSSQENSPNSSSESLLKTRNGLRQRPNYEVHFNTSDSSILDTSLNKNADEVIGIADLYGFENSKCNGMEQICTNLCSETIHHFYTTHIFKTIEGYYREEGLQNEVDFIDNSLCIELLTCQDTGILTYLDHETLSVDGGSSQRFMDKLQSKHGAHKKFFTSNCESLQFGVVHHNTKVVYDTKELLLSNVDAMADGIVRIFSKQHCNFGFVTHLFGTDLKSTLSPEKDKTQPSQSVASSSIMSTFSQDFQGKLDGLLKTLIQAQPWFILCIKSNREGKVGVFDHDVVAKQTKSLQLFETVYLLRSGLTQRMRILPFAQRYFAFQDHQLSLEDAIDVVKCYQRIVNEERKENPNKILYVGRKHVFFSEIMWQHLERDRREKEVAAKYWRQKRFEEEETLLSQKLGIENISSVSSEELTETQGALAHAATPPPIPKRRTYTVIENKKIGFPQARIMKDDYKEIINGKEVVFRRGETVKVIGASPKPGFLTVESKHKSAWVPYKLTKLMSDP